MSEPADADGLVDSGTALDREAALLAERFPDQDRADIADRLQARFAELGDSATIRAHLVPVASATVTEDLIAGGARFRSPITDGPADLPGD